MTGMHLRKGSVHMRDSIRRLLMEKAETGYREFSAALIPESKPLLGVRLPILRVMAKELVKNTDWRLEISSYEGEYEDIYFEEVMLRGMIIGYGTQKADEQTAIILLRDFIPHIDNWSVCDSFCNSFMFAAKHRELIWEVLQPYLLSEKEFEVRTAVILLLNHYLKYDKNGRKISRKRVISRMDAETDTSKEKQQNYPYLERILSVLNREYTQGYYAQMAVAWTIAEAFVTFPYETMQMLKKDCKMDVWTYNKSLQKICESKNPDAEVKQMIKTMKKVKK